MNVDLAQELLNVLGSSLENLETQHAALLQLLKDNGVVTDDQLAPYLARAGKASNVRWRAAHIRLDRLFDTEKQKEEQLAQKDQHKAETTQEPFQNQEQDANNKNDKQTGEAEPHESTNANPAKETAEAHSDSPTDGNLNQQAASGDKNADPELEKNDI